MRKRTKVMSIRVTAKEKQQIMLMAKLCKLSISDYLSYSGFGKGSNIASFIRRVIRPHYVFLHI